MILIGDKFIPYEKIEKISNIDDIKYTTPNSTLIFGFDISFMQYCQNNNLAYGVEVHNIKESIYANALSAKYIICKLNIAKTIQTIAQNYMFDSRVLAIIEDSSMIEEVALQEIDGIIYLSCL
ncbi:MAG: hypothetical protein RBQ81_03650 [Arcobacteraceae bacterium]|nr:hypothetical protein [Arcobacteraceae bacterium]MDY0364943.1 hypothetical protein [Arcobacteraceae bacterium]